MLAFSAYLLVGPHLAYAALSPGYPPAWMFHFGVLGRLDLGGIRRREQQGGDELPAWAFVGTCDTMFAVLVSAQAWRRDALSCCRGGRAGAPALQAPAPTPRPPPQPAPPPCPAPQVHACFCLLPATLWVACVVARRLQLQHYYSPVSRSSSRDSSASGEARQRMEAGGGSAASLAAARGGARSRCLGGAAACSRWSFSGPQVAAWLALAAFNWATLYRRAGALMTWAAVLLSPGFAWTLPFAALLVVAWGGPRRPCGWAAKGE